MTDAAEETCCLFGFHGNVIPLVDHAIRSEGGDPWACELECYDRVMPDLAKCRVTTRGIHVCWLWIIDIDGFRCQVQTNAHHPPWEDENPEL